jgi:hypothetical protein
MPINNGESSSLDLGALIEGLTRADVEFIIVGGIAAVVQGAPITTMDVDIVHNQSDENINRLNKFLKSVEAVPQLASAGLNRLSTNLPYAVIPDESRPVAG